MTPGELCLLAETGPRIVTSDTRNDVIRLSEIVCKWPFLRGLFLRFPTVVHKSLTRFINNLEISKINLSKRVTYRQFLWVGISNIARSGQIFFNKKHTQQLILHAWIQMIKKFWSLNSKNIQIRTLLKKMI